MQEPDRSMDGILRDLQERAKELNCLYRVDEVLSRMDLPRDEVLQGLVGELPAGWQYPDLCRARLIVEGKVYADPEFVESPWSMASQIRVQDQAVGTVEVVYLQRTPTLDEGPFLKEEYRLIRAIADRLGLFLLQRRLRRAHQSLEQAIESIQKRDRPPLSVLLEFLRRTDSDLLHRITRKMINYLSWNGVVEAQKLLGAGVELPDEGRGDENRPALRRRLPSRTDLTEAAFAVAETHMTETEIIAFIQTWIKEEKSSYLIRTLENLDTNLGEIAEAVERYQAASVEEGELPASVRTSLKVSLLRRFFTDRLEFINLAKSHVDIKDFYVLARHLVFPPKSQGKLGGKGAGLFLADRILAQHQAKLAEFPPIKVPNTWYVASDGVLEFMHHNNLDDLYNQKYLDIERIRQDYPHVIQVFKNSEFPPEMSKGLAVALDDFENRPLIVRSSSLLEDRAGSAFSGKYKSLFLANQGTKRQRLEALQDAVAEVYASIFGPDPIEYRAERGLLDFREEMGVLIQEVVGTRVGRYFLPAFAGVGFSHNEFRWSSRIRREDGLLRLVPGLGTRAVDRLADDYPVLVSPGQPGLRVNVSPEEILRYSPRFIDVINLETNQFETVEVLTLLREAGDDYPLARKMISMVDRERVRRPVGLEPDWEKDRYAFTMHGLFAETRFLAQMKAVLELLQSELDMPVDIEFAHDGTDLYLVQCRAQSYGPAQKPASIPRDIPADRVIFSAHRYVSNGWVPDVTHIVYVNPAAYAALPAQQDMIDVARAVGKLNLILPKRQFVLIGPGRWGSRGDIKLGVGVTYSDINNTSVLLEVARQKGNYTPELSFGTHFFQDLVEADIRYLPLYPDEDGNVLNEQFLLGARNIFARLAPEYARLDSVVRVIDVRQEADGRVLRVLMNAELDEAVGVLAPPTSDAEPARRPTGGVEAAPEDHWRWRLRMAEGIAGQLDPERFGVRGIYLVGSTKNAAAGPKADIDLIVHFTGNAEQREALLAWFEGWSLSLAEMNYLRTGYRTAGLLDVHLVGDAEIQARTGVAGKIGAITDAALLLEMKRR